MEIIAKPVNFKFSEYLSNGFDFMKTNFGNLFVAYIFCIIMGIIPFCGILAVGNFYKYCRKLRTGENASPGEIFNFDDFVPFFILQLIVIAGMIIVFSPFFILPFITEQGENPPVFFMIYMVVIMIAIFVVALKAFYIPGLISLGKITDVKTVWNISKTMTKGNLLLIFLFSIVTGILGELGILLCVIGIFLTIPFMYVSNYFALEDGLQQIQQGEIEEKNEF